MPKRRSARCGSSDPPFKKHDRSRIRVINAVQIALDINVQLLGTGRTRLVPSQLGCQFSCCTKRSLEIAKVGGTGGRKYPENPLGRLRHRHLCSLHYTAGYGAYRIGHR